MEIILSFAIVILAIILAVFAEVLPFLCWKVFQLERKLEKQDTKINALDEVLSEALNPKVPSPGTKS